MDIAPYQTGPDLESQMQASKKQRVEDVSSQDTEGDDDETRQSTVWTEGALTTMGASLSSKKSCMSKAREIRLEQNRKAARESRRRKKVMVEELQRSVIIFSRTNGTLKKQNEELQRLLLQAQSQIITLESGQHVNTKVRSSTSNVDAESVKMDKESVSVEGMIGSQTAQHMNQSLALAQVHAQQMANFAQQQATAQALYECQGFPPMVARTAAQSLLSSATPNALLSSALAAAQRNTEMPMSSMNGGGNILPQSLNSMLPQWPSLLPALSANMMSSSINNMNNNLSTNPSSLQEALGALYTASLPSMNVMSSNNNFYQQQAELLHQLNRGNQKDDSQSMSHGGRSV